MTNLLNYCAGVFSHNVKRSTYMKFHVYNDLDKQLTQLTTLTFQPKVRIQSGYICLMFLLWTNFTCCTDKRQPFWIWRRLYMHENLHLLSKCLSPCSYFLVFCVAFRYTTNIMIRGYIINIKVNDWLSHKRGFATEASLFHVY